MKKALLEHHYEFRIESLRDDPSVNYEKRLATVEHIANFVQVKRWLVILGTLSLYLSLR
jgi:hypothetical protein